MRPLTALTMTAGQTKTAADLLVHDRWVWLNNESPSNVTVKTTIGAINLPGYCSNLFDLCGEGGSPSLSCMAAVVLNYVNPPAVLITGDIYEDTERFILPPRGLVPLTRQVSIGNSIVLASSAQEIDSTYSGNATHPQIDTATPATGLGVQDQKASGYIELYPTQTDGTARGIALGRIDAAGTLHIDNFFDASGVLNALSTVITGRGGFGGSSPALTFASANHILEHWSPQAGAAAGHAFYSWNGSAIQFPLALGINPNAAGFFISHAGAVSSVAGQATAGNFGVPPITAVAFETAVTATTQQTIFSFTSVAGLYAVYGTVFLSNPTSPQAVLFAANFTDRSGTGNMNMFTLASSTSIKAFDGVQTFATGSLAYYCPPLTFTTTGGSVSLIFRDPGGTPNDKVSGAIIRLA